MRATVQLHVPLGELFVELLCRFHELFKGCICPHRFAGMIQRANHPLQYPSSCNVCKVVIPSLLKFVVYSCWTYSIWIDAEVAMYLVEIFFNGCEWRCWEMACVVELR